MPFGVIADKSSTMHKPLIKPLAEQLSFVEKGDINFKYTDARYRNLKTYNAFFSSQILYDDSVTPILTRSGENMYWKAKRNINDTEYRQMSTFPSDFNFCGQSVRYVYGMSVPPLMTSKIAEQIKIVPLKGI